jgi:hypothetical protein
VNFVGNRSRIRKEILVLKIPVIEVHNFEFFQKLGHVTKKSTCPAYPQAWASIVVAPSRIVFWVPIHPYEGSQASF